ncbi:hypothetical protein U9M48_002129, partial [Paspalum notatum var. saurae]
RRRRPHLSPPSLRTARPSLPAARRHRLVPLRHPACPPLPLWPPRAPPSTRSPLTRRIRPRRAAPPPRQRPLPPAPAPTADGKEKDDGWRQPDPVSVRLRPGDAQIRQGGARPSTPTRVTPPGLRSRLPQASDPTASRLSATPRASAAPVGPRDSHPPPGLLRFVGRERGAPGLCRYCHGRRRLGRDEQEAADGRAIPQLPWCRAALVLAAILADFRLCTLKNLYPDICGEVM